MQMLQSFTPTTLEAMYKDLDEARSDLATTLDYNNLIDQAEAYRVLTNEITEIANQYEALTGIQLWAMVQLAN